MRTWTGDGVAPVAAEVVVGVVETEAVIVPVGEAEREELEVVLALLGTPTQI